MKRGVLTNFMTGDSVHARLAKRPIGIVLFGFVMTGLTNLLIDVVYGEGAWHRLVNADGMTIHEIEWFILGCANCWIWRRDV